MSILRHVILFIAGFTIAGQSAYSQAHLLNVKDHILKSGREVMLTKQLQELVDQCHENGGGTIYFPPGEYLTGRLFLKSGVYLELSPGATLYGSKEMGDYPHDGLKSLIYANGQHNLGIKGQGTVNGQGDAYWRGKPQPYIRPDRCILFENCTDVSIKQIHVTNSPNWNIDVRFCERVWIDEVTITSEREAPNADGIDPVSSKDVFISNCYINVGDDAICPKSRGNIPLDNLVVTNCILISDDSAIKFGTRSDSDIRNVLFSNIVIRDTQYGLAMYAKDGGTCENIRFDNIHVESTRYDSSAASKPARIYPIFIDLEKRDPESKMGKIKNVFFSNITIDSPNGNCLFFGQEESKIENMSLTNISYQLHHRQTFEGNTKPRGARSIKSETSNDFSDVPAHFTFAHIDGLTIDGLYINDMASENAHERRMIWGYDVHDVKISGFKNSLEVPNTELPQVHFKESTMIEITDSRPVHTVTPFLYLEGASTSEVFLQNNNFSYLNTIIEYDNNFDPEEIKTLNNFEPDK